MFTRLLPVVVHQFGCDPNYAAAVFSARMNTQTPNQRAASTHSGKLYNPAHHSSNFLRHIFSFLFFVFFALPLFCFLTFFPFPLSFRPFWRVFQSTIITFIPLTYFHLTMGSTVCFCFLFSPWLPSTNYFLDHPAPCDYGEQLELCSFSCGSTLPFAADFPFLFSSFLPPPPPPHLSRIPPRVAFLFPLLSFFFFEGVLCGWRRFTVHFSL